MHILHSPSGFLDGKLLVATPKIHGSCFDKAVIYLCVHNAGGAMGVIINHKVETIAFNDLLGQLNIPSATDQRNVPIHFGGPVEATRGFILHSSDYRQPDTIVNRDEVALSSSVSMLREIAQGRGPSQGILALGYTGWSAGQLESELEEGSWIAVPASKELLFGANNGDKWLLAAASQGIDFGRFSPHVGHA